MPIVINSSFGIMGANQSLESFDPSWTKFSGGSFGLQGTSTGTRRLRVGGPAPGGASTYRNLTPITPDLEIQYSVHFFGATSSRNVTLRCRTDPTFAQNYTLDFAGNGLTLYRVSGGVTQIGSHPLTVVLGATYNLRVRMVGALLQVYLNGALVISYTDPTPLAGYSGVEMAMQTVIGPGQSPTDGNSVQVGYFQLETLGGGPVTLDPLPVKSEFKTTLPTWTAGGKLDPVPAKSEFRVAAATLVRETVFLNFTPPYAQILTVTPSLTGSAVERDVPASYSEFKVANITLQSGQALNPSAERAEFRVATPDLEPGPVERTPTPVYSQWKVANVSIAMGLTLTADSVGSIWRTRKPTLKSRYDCCTIAPLQDRARVRTTQDGGAGCGVGVRGSDGMVWNKW